ncbi:MAG: S9 family peptidase, partial [Acidobacteria bacterium]|nr:S9 family peptidase [Acidobacteriota bacterium]
LSPDESKAALVFNDKGISRLGFYDLKTGKIETVSKLNPGVITNLEWSPDSKQIAFNLDYASEASSIYTVATGSSQITRWVHEPNAAGADENLPIVERIEWQSKPDGKIIGGWMFRSKKSSTTPRAVIIEFHGGPSEESRPVLNYNDLYYLNELGAVIIYPNVRGSKGAGKSFSLADNGASRINQLNDVDGLFDWIAKQSSLDSKRVGLRGFSYGGYLALLAAARFPERIAAVSAQAAPTNFATFLTNNPAWRVRTSRTEYGDETNPQIKQSLEKVAIPNMAGNLKIPILLAHGELDVQVQASESKQLIAAVEKQSPQTPLWTVFSRPDKHGFGGVRSFYVSLLETVFFEKYVIRRDETNNQK